MTTELTGEMLHAHTETDTGATIRLRGYETSEGWMEAVEVVEGGPYVDDEELITTVHEGRGLRPNAVYNQMVEPFTGPEGGAQR